MGFRLLRICNSPELFEKRLEDLKTDFLKPRNYKEKLINDQFERIRSLPGETFEEKRNFALEKGEKVDKKPK
jgi:hypothetical protein